MIPLVADVLHSQHDSSELIPKQPSSGVSFVLVVSTDGMAPMLLLLSNLLTLVVGIATTSSTFVYQLQLHSSHQLHRHFDRMEKEVGWVYHHDE